VSGGGVPAFWQNSCGCGKIIENQNLTQSSLAKGKIAEAKYLPDTFSLSFYVCPNIMLGSLPRRPRSGISGTASGKRHHCRLHIHEKRTAQSRCHKAAK
jgi:hypothetical protein